MPTDPEVDAWFARSVHPLKPVMLAVRAAILGVDPRIGEAIKWKSPTFIFQGNIASIDPRAKQYVNLMFHQGAKLPGPHPSLEGGAGTVKYLRFADLADVTAKRGDWQLRSGPGSSSSRASGNARARPRRTSRRADRG
jgi:hypothetical protein